MKRLLQNSVILLLAIIFISSFAYAIDNGEAKLRKDLPKLLGSSNEGKEFYMTFHPCWETTVGKTDGCKIYITSAVATRVTVEIPGREVYIQRTTIPNDIIEISLDPAIAQCYRKTDRQQPQPQRIFKGYGIIVNADDPIICYGVTRYQYTSDGYMAIPKSALGKNYVVSSYNDPCKDDGNQYLTSYTSIVGVYNYTDVKVKLGGRANNYTPGANPMKTGETRKERLNRGDVWLIGVMGDYNDLTGTTVEANKPVSVISGSFCAYVPLGVSACDFLIEQDMPMESWGYRYHVARILKRLKASIIRVFASEPNTTIYREGNEWALVKEVGGAEGTGYIEIRAVAESELIRPVTISAKNRIAVTQYNAGNSDDGISSDPFQMALIPLEQYQNSLLWCTPGVNGGSQFRENFLNLCYKSTENGKIPEDLEFGKVSNGVFSWRKLSTVVTNPGQVFIDTSLTDSRKYRALTILIEDPAGVYSLRGNDPMMGYLYGFGNSDSYGYPVSTEFRDLSKPDVWAPEPTYAFDCKGNIQGRVTEQPVNDDSLRSNLANMYLVKGESYNFTNLVYDEANFVPGTSYVMNWSLGVLDQESDGKAVVFFSDRAGNDTTITIDYQKTKFTILNKLENWGRKDSNDPPETREFTLINESVNPIIVDSILLLSKDVGRDWGVSGFEIDSSIYREFGGLLPYLVKPGENIKFKVTFDPNTLKNQYLAGIGQFIDSIGIKSTKSGTTTENCYFKYKSAVKVALEATCILVDQISFGQEIIGNTLTKQFTISNSGKSDLTIIGYNLYTGEGDGIYNTNIGNISVDNPLLIPVSECRTFDISFTPNKIGEFPNKITFVSDADTNCADYDPILDLNGEGINLEISQIDDVYMDENTSKNIQFSINTDDTIQVKLIKQSDKVSLIPTDSMIITRNGKNCNLKITPDIYRRDSCNLTITATNNVVSASTKFKVVVSKAGIVEDNTITGNDLSITPNPVNANFSINSETLIIQEVMIYDISGTLVLQTDQISNIDISGLTAGVYYCVVKSNGNSYSVKFEIVR